MAVFLVDYENVHGTGGLWGVEALTPKESLYIFYSTSCPTIYRRDAELIEKSGCKFHTIFLLTPGKNALDFMIVSQLGIFAERGYKKLLLFQRITDLKKEKINSIRALMKNLNMTAEKAMTALNIAPADFKNYIAML